MSRMIASGKIMLQDVREAEKTLQNLERKD